MTTSFIQFPLFSAVIWDLASSRPVHFSMLFSHLLFSLPRPLSPFTVPCKMVLARPFESQTCPYRFSLRLYNSQDVFVRPDCLLDLGSDFLVGNSFFLMLFFYETHSILQHRIISMACILLCSSAVRVHNSRAYRKMNVTRERISRILELRKMRLLFQTGFSLVNAAVVCAILKGIPGLEPSSDTTEARYLKLVTVSNFCPFTLSSALKRTLLIALSTWITLALMYFIIAHKAASQILLKAFLTPTETW